jgi:hypothetical protein
LIQDAAGSLAVYSPTPALCPARYIASYDRQRRETGGLYIRARSASPITSGGSARVFDAATGAYLDTVKNQSAATVPAQICLQVIRCDPLTCANDLYRSLCLQMVRRRP